MLKKMQTSYGNLQMPASLQTQVLMVWGQVLVNFQLKCDRGIVAGGGGCPSPAPWSTSQRHTHTHTDTHSLFPRAMNGPSPGPGLPPKHQRSTGFRTYAYTALSYALVVLFMPVSRMLHLTQWGKWCLEQQQNKQTNQQTRYIQLESRVLAKRGGKDVNGQHSSWNW